MPRVFDVPIGIHSPVIWPNRPLLGLAPYIEQTTADDESDLCSSAHESGPRSRINRCPFQCRRPRDRHVRADGLIRLFRTAHPRSRLLVTDGRWFTPPDRRATRLRVTACVGLTTASGHRPPRLRYGRSSGSSCCSSVSRQASGCCTRCQRVPCGLERLAAAILIRPAAGVGRRPDLRIAHRDDVAVRTRPGRRQQNDNRNEDAPSWRPDDEVPANRREPPQRGDEDDDQEHRDRRGS
jgi:hypothetical protein